MDSGGNEYIFCNGLSVEHPDDPVTIPCVMFTVCYHHNGGTLFIQFGKQFHYVITIAASRLPVGSSARISLGLFTTARGNGYTLLLATRKLLRVVVAAMHDLHLVQHFFHSFFSSSLFTPVDQRQFHIFKNSEFIDEIKTLEHEANIMFAQVGSFAFVEVGHFDVVENETAASGSSSSPRILAGLISRSPRGPSLLRIRLL